METRYESYKDCILLIKSTFTGQIKNGHIYRPKGIREMLKRPKKSKFKTRPKFPGSERNGLPS